jgi:hypothetical protein
MSVRALTVAFVAFAFVAVAGTAHADKVSKKFAGQVILSNKKFPNKAKSPAAYIAKIKKNKKTKFMENKETKEWKIYFAAFFKKPLTDLEYTIKFVDSKGNLVGTPFEQFTDSSGESSILSDVTLDRKTFGVNKKLTIVIEQGGRKIASGSFQILGEAEKYSGKVDFSEDEAANGSSDE